MFSHVLAVVGGIDYDGTICGRTVLQSGQNLADFVIHPLNEAVVEFAALLDDFLGHRIDVKPDSNIPIVAGLGVDVTFGYHRHGYPVPVLLPIRFRNYQREVWREVAAEHEERFFIGPAMFEKIDGTRGYLAVAVEHSGVVARMKSVEPFRRTRLRLLFRVASRTRPVFSAWLCRVGIRRKP